ncbi:MAG: DHH family phosphoesterase [Tepidisphaeraceae bacterium]|jgi:phosphoesterase RecJ-like protein
MTDLYQPFLDRLCAARRVLITTHVRPDGDALGTTAAMAMALRRKSIEAEVLLFSRLPGKYAFIFQENHIAHHDVESAWPAHLSLEKFDTLLVVDTGTWSQLPGLRPRLDGWTGQRLVLDHHLTQENWADCKLIDTQAAAAGEIAADLLEHWQVPFDPPVATALFLAIASDTGWFQFSNTRPRTLRLAADLMEAGVDTDRIYRLLYQNERIQRLALQTRAQQSLQLLHDNRLAVMRLRRNDFEQAGASVLETENLINIPLQVQSVEVSILMVESPDGQPVRVSLRSKESVDVAKFAEQFGGGGHARAAGLRLPGDFQLVCDRIVNAMLDLMKREDLKREDVKRET